MLFFMVRVGSRLYVWNMKLIWLWWKVVSCWGLSVEILVLLRCMVLLVGWLSFVVLCSSVFLFELDGFMIVVNELWVMVRLMLWSVVILVLLEL